MRSFITCTRRQILLGYQPEDVMDGTCSTHGRDENAFKSLVEKPDGKRPLGRPSRRWEDHIRMDRREVLWGGAELIHLTQNRDQWWALVKTVMNLRVP
jgi:hypothetical protein